jgi:hypothetical protein
MARRLQLFMPLSERPHRITLLLLLLSVAIVGFIITWDVKRLMATSSTDIHC